eukprot:8005357-Alexandrium_andersonii.AAC.1
MSASLVGSEMCIRDRSGPIGLTQRLSLRQGRSRHSGCSGRHRRFSSVSYTHLTLPTICSV